MSARRPSSKWTPPAPLRRVRSRAWPGASRLGGAGLLLASMLAAGCDSEVPEPAASLRRPSALAYAARTSTTGAFPRRADLFLADSEAQGVRLVQLLQDVDAAGIPFDRLSFAPAPSVFFPLLIPAEGFPIDLALSADSTRLFALSPLEKRLHVLDVEEIAFNAPPGSDHNRHLGEIDLDALVSPGATPVAVASLGVAGGADVVLVAFDAGNGAPGLLAALVIPRGGSVSPSSSEVVELGPAPRDLVVRGGSVLATSAASPFVTVVAAAADGSPILSPATYVDVGASTSLLVSAGAAGVLALSPEAGAAFVLVEVAGGIERSSASFTSPYARTPEAGRVDLPPSPATAGAFGRLRSPIVSLPSGVTVLFEGVSDVVAITHIDGETTLLRGESLELLPSSAVGLASIRTCDGRAAVELSPEVRNPVGVLGSRGGVLRGSFRGALARSRTATITAAGAGLFELTDPAVHRFDDRQIRAGDPVLLQLDVPASCTSTGAAHIELVLTATTSTVTADRLVLSVEDPPPALDCAPGAALPVAVYEVYPAAADVVVARYTGTSVSRVLERRSVVGTSGGSRVDLSTTLILAFTSSVGFTCETTRAAGALCLADDDCAGSVCVFDAGACAGRCEAPCPEGAARCVTEEVVRRCTGLVAELEPAVASDAAGDIVFSPLRGSFFMSQPAARRLTELYQSSDGTLQNDPVPDQQIR